MANNGQMPAPTIVAHYDQTLNITVFNEMLKELLSTGMEYTKDHPRLMK